MKKKSNNRMKPYLAVMLVLLVAAVVINYKHYKRDHPTPIVLNGATENDYVAVFSQIYEEKHWNIGSGPGSNPENAAPYMVVLQQYFDDPRFNSIVDLGCGDWQIMRNIRIPPNKTYLGFDVAPMVIDANTAEYKKENVRFYHSNGLHEFAELKISGDLLIVKDVLQHWPHSEIEFFIANVLPNFKYALITNQLTVGHYLHNKDAVMGPTRSLALLEAPFKLKDVTPVMEYGVDLEHKQVLLYVNPNNA